MKAIYVLTSQGEKCNEKEIERVNEILRNELQITEDYTVFESEEYNKPECLIKELRKNKNNAYIFIICDDGFRVLWDKNIKVLLQNLKDHKDDTSWSTAFKSTCELDFW